MLIARLVVVSGEFSVFVSRTSDMASFPVGRSFARAACDAAIKVGAQPIDMSYFAAREGVPAEYCRGRVRGCDVYLGVIGFRYGSAVSGESDLISYTELEFEEASRAGKPRLLFLLDGTLFRTAEDRILQLIIRKPGQRLPKYGVSHGQRPFLLVLVIRQNNPMPCEGKTVAVSAYHRLDGVTDAGACRARQRRPEGAVE